MALSAIVALCLLALASAAPQNLENLHCVTTCDPSTQPYKPLVHKTFHFSYNVLSSVKLAGVDGAITQGGLTGTVEMTTINACEVAAKFINSDENGKVSKYPVVWSLSGYGKIGKFCAHPEDDTESINFKRGILSVVQNSIPSASPIEKMVVSETSVLGKCPTTYSVETDGDNIVVNKQIVQSECQDHAFSHSDIPSLLSKSPLPLQDSKSECTHTFSSDMYPQKYSCKDTKKIRPSYGTYKYVEATQESTLKLLSVSTDMSILSSINGVQLLDSKLTFDHGMTAKIPELSGKLDTVLKDVCEKLQGQGHPETASAVNEAIELMEHIPGEAFITVLSKIRAGDYCTDYSKLESLYLDAVAFISQPGALKVIAQEVSAGRVTGGRTALYTAALNLISKPTAKHAEAVTPIAAMEDPSSTLSLAAASVVNKHCKACKLPTLCQTCPIVDNFVKILTDKLVNQCTPAFSNSKPITVLTTLKTLGNIGYIRADHAEKIITCATTEGIETNVRFVAALALEETQCTGKVYNALKAIVIDAKVDTEVRIGAHLGGIHCADKEGLLEVISALEAESNKQVQSYIFSDLNYRKKTSVPKYANVKALLTDVNIPSTYESNAFKYSRSYEISYNTPNLRDGAAAYSNVIYTPESYFPRMVWSGLDMNLLGDFINIGEVGARVEGLDPLIKEVFGPESYLYKTPLSGMIKDSSLFIKQNGSNMLEKLEKMIKNGNFVDINSLIQSASMFLKANNIKLPKTDLYAKLMGQELAFLSLTGPMQEVNINKVVDTIKSSVVNALIAAKDFNVNTARAAHLHLDYAIPTIQGIPLNVKLMTTSVTGFEIQSKLDSKDLAHNAILKIIPNLSIAINGHIGYGNKLQHGLKMKNTLYTTSGLAMHISLKNGQDLELKFELPEKMDLINIKSELYQFKTNDLMTEEKIYPTNIKDTRIVKEHCSTLIDPLTGLHVCFKMNIPDVLDSNSLPLGHAAQFNVYLQKHDAAMKGYKVTASFQNKAERKVLKMVAGTYGSASSTETSVKLSYTKEANTYQTAAEIESVWFKSSAKTSLMLQENLASLQFIGKHQLTVAAPKTVACKLDIKKGTIAKGNEYMVTGFAGLTERMTEGHKFLTMKISHATNGDLINANFSVKTETAKPLSLGFELDIPTAAPWFTVIQKADLKGSVGNTLVEGLIQRKMPGQYQNTLTIIHGAVTVVSLTSTHTVTGNAFTNFNFITDTSAKLGVQEIGTTFNLKYENAVFDTIWTLRNAGATVFKINAKHAMKNKLYTTIFEVGFPTLPKTFKFSNAINVVEFLSFKITSDLHMDNTALLNMEGPVSLQLTKSMINHNMDLKITGAFEGSLKVLNTALLSFEKIQYTLDMSHSATPLTMINVLFDQTNPAEITTKAVINVPVLVKAEYVTVVTPKMLHTTMNTLIVPTTSLARRFKGYAEVDFEGLKLKTNFFWDAEKDTNKKMALTTSFKTDKSLGKLLVQGDLTFITKTYGYKLETLLASPSKWFLGTTGFELSVTAPSNKIMIGKALCTIEYSESLVIFKPLMAVHTLNENKYEIAGSFSFKNLPALWNFDIRSEVTIDIPQIQKMTVATKFLHEENNGACTTLFKAGITGLTQPTVFEITHSATGNKYTTLFKIQHGATVGSVSNNVVLISGYKAFEMTVDASLPFAVVKALSMRATKTTEGSLTVTLSKNQMVLAKLNYAMTSPAAHTLSLECPSRTIEFFIGFSKNEITLKVFPEKNLSPKVLESIMRVTSQAGSTKIECFLNAPSLLNEIKFAAEFSLTNPTMDKIVNVDIHFPVAEFKKLVIVMVEEIIKIYEDLVKDGVFPNLDVVYEKIILVVDELPVYLQALKLQFSKFFNKYWAILRDWALTMWKNYESDLTWFIDFCCAEFLRCWGILKHEVPNLCNNLLISLKKTELWNILNGFVKQIMERYPSQFNILIDFYNRVVVTTIEEVQDLVIRIINLPALHIGAVWNVLVKEVPVIFIKVKDQLFNSDLWNVIIETIKNIEVQFPALYSAVVDIWTGFIKPVYMDLVIVVKKINNINFKDMAQLVDKLMRELTVFFNNFIARLMDTKVVKLFITMMQEFVAANPMIKIVFEEVVTVLHKIKMALLEDFEMFYEKLMNIPVFRKIVEWMKHIINTKEIIMFQTLSTVHIFMNEVKINGDYISVVMSLPVSVTTLQHWWTTVTARLPAFVDDLINSMKAFIENLPVYIATVKEQVAVFVKIAAEQVKVIVKAIEAYVPKFINEFVPVFNNFIEFLRNTEVFKFMMAKINEIIKMYPAQFRLVKEYFEMFIKLVGDYTTLIYNRMMEIPIIKRVVEYILNLIFHKDVESGMFSSWSSISSSVSSYSLSSWNSVSSSLSSYSSAVSNNVPTFIKLHTPQMVSSWVSALMQ